MWGINRNRLVLLLVIPKEKQIGLATLSRRKRWCRNLLVQTEPKQRSDVYKYKTGNQ